VLPAPNLDDRRFQDLVDDAKRLVQQRCPTWTDHNVSDPGVTLIEAFAFMVDQLLYRLNRVPERHYVKFLELIGVHLFPPTAAQAEVTAWLSAPQPEIVRVKAGTEVATPRAEVEEAVVFQVAEDLDIVPCALARVASSIAESDIRDHTDMLGGGKPFYCFDQVPKPGDCLYIGLTNPVPSCAVLLEVDCQVEGVGVDPLDPPWIWEAWDGERWAACEVDRDTTGGFNQPGNVVVHVRRHASSVVGQESAAWLRCRVVEAAEHQPDYSASPRIGALAAATIGGTVTAVHGDLVLAEKLPPSEGVPGQVFALQHAPVTAATVPPVLEVSVGEGWEEWTRVETFALSGPDDRHFVLDESAGQIQLGPAVREPDGTLRHFGAVPPKGAVLRLSAYRTGGGRTGNVAAGALCLLRSPIPYVASVENRRPAAGGVDGETVEDAKVRGPLLLRTRDRAVTAEDYEHLTRQAAPEIARVRCVPAGDEPGGGAGAVRVLLVPAIPEDDGAALPFELLAPSEETLARVASHLDERRLIGARVAVEPPRYQGVTVVARIRARSHVLPARLQSAALDALYRWFHPLRGGPEGNGWPFGRPVNIGDVYAVLQALPGTEYIEEVRLYGADLTTGTRGESTTRLVLEPNTLVFSYQHQVRVEGS